MFDLRPSRAAVRLARALLTPASQPRPAARRRRARAACGCAFAALALAAPIASASASTTVMPAAPPAAGDETPSPDVTTGPAGDGNGNGPIITTVIDRGIGGARLLAALEPDLLAFARTLDGRDPVVLARRRAFTPRFSWLVPGTIELAITAPAALARRAAQRLRDGAPLTVARGVARRTRSGHAVIVTRLTRQGRALLRRVRRVRLTITATFSPWDGPPVAGREMAALHHSGG